MDEKMLKKHYNQSAQDKKLVEVSSNSLYYVIENLLILFLI